MTEKEVQMQKEIMRLQKKVKILTEAYNSTAMELEQMKKQQKKNVKMGRPGIDVKLKARIIALYQQGNPMRKVANATGISLGMVHKVLDEAAKKSRIVYVYMDREMPSTIIDVYGVTRKIKVVNLTDDMISRAFGIRKKPTWQDYEEFLESRCMPRTRYGIREELKYIGLDSYDPFAIVEKTQGRVYGDGQWLWKMSEVCVKRYDEIMNMCISVEECHSLLEKFLKQEAGR